MPQNCARAVARAQFYIQGEKRGHGGKERAIGPFFSPVAVLLSVI